MGFHSKTAQIRSYFITLWSRLVLLRELESFAGRDSHFPPRKSLGALSSPLFNGSIAILTPSCLRALFPCGYCAISYSCGFMADTNAYFPCQPGKLNWIGVGGRKTRDKVRCVLKNDAKKQEERNVQQETEKQDFFFFLHRRVIFYLLGKLTVNDSSINNWYE